jgi:hypothetical protein
MLERKKDEMLRSNNGCTDTRKNFAILMVEIRKCKNNSSLGGSCFMGNYVMATSVTTFKVKQSKERRPEPFDNVGGNQTLR